MEQRVKGTLEIWANPFTPLRVPKVFHLSRDPYERADVSPTPITTGRCREPIFSCRRKPYVGKFLETPRQKPASFTVGGQMEALEKSLSRLQGDID
jgi:hypothetical protein